MVKPGPDSVGRNRSKKLFKGVSVDDSDRVRQLQDTIALRLLPSIRDLKRIAQATLVWTVLSAIVMLAGWAAVIAILAWGVTHGRF